MDNKENINQDPKKQDDEEFTVKSDFKVYKIAILVLIVIIGALIFMLLTTHLSLRNTLAEKEERIELNRQLQVELDSVMYEYTVFKNQHDSILYDKDSIIQQNAREIERLLVQQADYPRIRRQLDYLRDIAQDYVVRIDSLYKVAEVLRTERDHAREEAAQIRTYATELEKDKEVLSTKVEVASALRADHIKATGYRTRGFTGRETEIDRAGRVDYVRVCITLAENPIAPEGERNIFIRISGPDEKILRISDADEYSFVHNEDTLQFTASKQIYYQNRPKEVCLKWDRYTEYMEGMYLVSVYTDEYRIGETAFTLR